MQAAVFITAETRIPEHDGIHRFLLGKEECQSKICGEALRGGRRQRKAYPESKARKSTWRKTANMEMEMVQIEGVDSTNRTNCAELAAGAKLIVRERLLTHGS